MATATAFIARLPSITINSVAFECFARKVSLVPEDNMSDVETFCNPGGEAPGATKWTCTISALQSFGTTGALGLWDTLRPLAKTTQTFVIKGSSAAVGPTNPSATFTAWVPSIPFIDSEVGGTTIMDIDFSVVGDVVFAIV